MRFCDFFLEYKLEVLAISPYIKIRDMEKYKLVGLGISILAMIVGVILSLLDRKMGGFFYLVAVISIVITLILAGRKKEKHRMLNEHYIPYSTRRMREFYKLLKKYGIDYNDEKKMNMLIEQVDLVKNRYCIIKGINSPTSAVCTYILIPVLITILNRFVDSIEINELLSQSIQWGLIVLMVFVMWIAMSSLIKSIFSGESTKYEDLKDDLQQMMIFGDMISSYKD